MSTLIIKKELSLSQFVDECRKYSRSEGWKACHLEALFHYLCDVYYIDGIADFNFNTWDITSGIYSLDQILEDYEHVLRPYIDDYEDKEELIIDNLDLTVLVCENGDYILIE